MAIDELGKSIKELERASKTLDIAGEGMINAQNIGKASFAGFTSVVNRFGLGLSLQRALVVKDFLQKRSIRKQAEKEVRQRLGGKDPISRETLKRLKKEADLVKKKEAVDSAFKNFVETKLGLSEEQLKQVQQRQAGKLDKSGERVTIAGKRGRFSTPERFLEKFAEESELARATAEKNQMKFSLLGDDDAGSPGDKNRAAEEERTRDQQAFETEKTESTNDILRDILAALTSDSPLKKDEADNSGILAGLGLANLLGSLGKLGKLLLAGGPLLLGLGLLAGALTLLKNRADEITKKIVDDTKKLEKAVEGAKTTEEATEAISGEEARRLEAERKRQRDTILSPEEKKALLQSGADLGQAKLEAAEKNKVVESSQSFNEIIKNSAMIFGAARDASIRDGKTIEARYASFDKVLAETIVKVKESKAFLDADEKNRKFMIQQVVAQANKALVGAGSKSVLLSGLSQEGMKGRSAIETTRARALAALAGGRGKFAEEGFGYLSDRLGGGRNTFSASQIASLQARVAQAQKDADEVTFLERNNPFGSGNQGDIDRLNSLTKELQMLREAIATQAAAPSIDASTKQIDQRDQSSKVTTTMTPMTNAEMATIPY